MQKLSILQISNDNDWTNYADNQNIIWKHKTIEDILFSLDTSLHDNYVLLSDEIIDNRLFRIAQEWPAQKIIFINKNQNPIWEQLFLEKQAIYLEGSESEIIDRIINDLSIENTNNIINFVNTFKPVNNYQYQYSIKGQSYIDFTINNTNFEQIGFIKNDTVSLSKGQYNFTLDYISEDVDLELTIYLLDNTKVISTKRIKHSQVNNVIPVICPKNNLTYQINIFAKGHGSIKVYSLIHRLYRDNLGTVIPFDDKYLTEDNQELITYFNPGFTEFKNKFIVLFAGDISIAANQFTQKSILDYTKYPYLIITDSRTQNGAFHFGNKQYEELIIKTIKSYLEKFDSESLDLIFVGQFTSSLASLYYAKEFNTNCVILTEPFLNFAHDNNDNNYQANNYKNMVVDAEELISQYHLGSPTKVFADNYESVINHNWKNVDLSIFNNQFDDYNQEHLNRLISDISSFKSLSNEIFDPRNGSNIADESKKFILKQLQKRNNLDWM